MAEGHALAPARWSRHVTRRVRCPDAHETEAFLSWLFAFGAASPGHVLLPTSDDLAWLIARNREALAAHFRLLPTPFAAVDAVLDKHALLGHCQAVGLDFPETWFPRSLAEALAIGAQAGFPLLVKPRSQVLFASHTKGSLVSGAGDLRARFGEFVARNPYGEQVRRHDPDIVWPMLQRYYPSAREHIYGLSGYADGRGELAAVRAARKILQRPRKLGIGLCFEEADVDERLAAGLAALFRRVGYQGVFEVEFVEVGSRAVLIDVNPRFYSQLAFDLDRGLPLPRLAYADALGDAAMFSALVAEARAWRPPAERVYCHRFLFEVMLRSQRLSGRLTADEERRWRRWWAEHRRDATDAVADARDPAPWCVDTATHLAGWARHPRAFVRSIVLDQ
jgi:predicted ATP-grasp superfamily ATP-dependent carboligase